MAAFEKDDTELIFKQLDVSRHGCGRDMEFVSRELDTEQAADDFEGAKGIE
ncbi:hypothetical protein PTKU46_88040 [Paraburkholderia terrae]